MIKDQLDTSSDSFLNANIVYILPYFVLWSAAVFYLFNGGERGDVIQFFARHRSTNSNHFFVFCSSLGEAYAYIIAIIGFLFVAYSKSIAFLLNALFVLIFSGALKWLFRHERPVRYFNDLLEAPDLANYISDVPLHQGWTTSFPSGHTTSAFAFFSLLAFFMPRASGKLLCLLLAVLVACSRMYLVQHFLKDIAAGMITGGGVALIVFAIHQKIAQSVEGHLPRPKHLN